MSPLEGKLLRRAEKALELSTRLGDGASLLTKDNLMRCGFLPGGPSSPVTSVREADVGFTHEIGQLSPHYHTFLLCIITTFLNSHHITH